MKKIIILLSLVFWTISAQSQYFIKAIDYKGCDAYVWKFVRQQSDLNKSVLVYALYSSELSNISLDEQYCEYPGLFSKDSMYIKSKNCELFKGGTLVTVPFQKTESEIIVDISNDPVDSSIRKIAVTAYKNNLYVRSLTLDMDVRHYKADTLNRTVPIKWVVNNTDTYLNTGVGEYDTFNQIMKTNGLTINAVISMGIGYGDADGQINIKEGYKFENNKWTK